MLISEPHLQIVKGILQKYPYTFYAFGSRVRGGARLLSDLDLCYFETIPSLILAHLEEDFEKSDLPFCVDMIDGCACTPEFQNILFRDRVAL